MGVAEGNVGLAIGLVCGAGAATAIGASAVFFPSIVKLASRRTLAASLGLSAGVMLYVSFVEIFAKAVVAFGPDNAGFTEDKAFNYATLTFFCGIVLMKMVDILVKWFSGGSHTHHHEDVGDIQITWNENECNLVEQEEAQEVTAPHCIGCAEDPVGELEEWQRMADKEIEEHNHPKENNTVENSANDGSSDKNSDEEVGDKTSEDFQDNADQNQNGGTTNIVVIENATNTMNGGTDVFRAPPQAKIHPEEQKKKLVNMGLSTAFAIALHNFPEGLATFVAALTDPGVGVVLAIAIGIHNIPEGLCVSLPIYYATGNRCKGFMWGCLSGISEPIAALLGWAVLANAVSQTVYATLFGIVSGMMVMISIKELIPTAHRYDPEDTVVTYAVVIGMAIMAVSLVLFKL
jgi:ZIP family zinc transporter